MLALYFAPSLAAKAHAHRNYMPIFLINFFFAWTLLGWVIAMIWACHRDASGHYA
jgi:hypothetical protein